jgi:hypothetical protein
MELYRDVDIQAITDKLDQIIDDSITIKKKTLEPTIDECLQVKEVIKDYIMKKKRIIYGGTAYNELIKQKNKKDAIYKDMDCKDIEFYSPKPIDDAMELANLLHEKKYKFVQVRQAMHAETYTIFVNFEQYCDMSYMPSNIFLNMPTILIDGLLYSDPMWILVDILRQYNDPITSYWRLKDKTFFRANVLLKNYPLNLKIQKEKDENKEELTKYDNIKLEIYKKIKSLHTLIFLGSVAENYYLKRSTKINTTNMEVISTNYINDIKIINNIIADILQSKYKNIQINSYKPFFQFRDEHIEFILDDIILLKVFGSNHKCIPFNILHLEHDNVEKIEKIQLGGYFKKINKKLIGGSTDTDIIKIATFMVLFQHILVERHYLYINRLDKYKVFDSKLGNLLKTRNEYLNSKTLTVMDSSPYKGFILRCSGETIDQGREFRLGLIKRKAQGAKLLFTYDPDGKKDFKVPDFKFENTSGNFDKSDIKKIFDK